MARLVDLIITTEKDILKLIRYPFARDKLMALRVGMSIPEGETGCGCDSSGSCAVCSCASMTALNLQPAVFLDRDGTLIRDVGYLTRVEQIEILKGVPAALRALRAAGFKTVVVTISRRWRAAGYRKRC